MNDHNEVVGIFPTPVYFALPENIENLQDSINFLHNLPLSIDTEADTELRYGGVSADSYILNRPECGLLKEWILKHVNIYCKEVLAWDYNKISITQSWVSTKCKGQKHVMHRHPNSLVSGVFYWQDDIEDISFLKPEPRTNFSIKRNTEIDSVYAWDYHKFSPKKNTLVLFPSEQKHGVAENFNDTPRKSLAFNTMIFEKIGMQEELSELDLSRINDR